MVELRTSSARLDWAAFPNVLTADEITALGPRALGLVGGKNYNMAQLNSIPGVRGAEFRAVTASAYDRHLDQATIDGSSLDAFLSRLFARTDFKALAAKDGNAFQQDFVLAESERFVARFRGKEDVPLRSYLDGLIAEAKQALAARPEDRLEILRRLSISAQIAMLAAPMPEAVEQDLRAAYQDLCDEVGTCDSRGRGPELGGR